MELPEIFERVSLEDLNIDQNGNVVINNPEVAELIRRKQLNLRSSLLGTNLSQCGNNC